MIAHPECEQHLLDLADFIGSTSMLLNYSQSSEASGFIVLTEPGILYQMRKAVPNKEFHAVPGLDGCSCNACPHAAQHARQVGAVPRKPRTSDRTR